MKHILLTYSDPLLARLHRERLETASCEVTLAPDRESALRVLEEKGADLIVIDLLRSQEDGLDFALALKGLPNGRRAPFLALPGASFEVEEAAAQVGIPTVHLPLEPSAKEPRDVLMDAMDRTMGRHPGALASCRSSEGVEKNWRKTCLEGVVESVATLRKQIFSLAQQPENLRTIQEALMTSHHLAHRCIEAGLLSLYRLARALSSFIHELQAMPEYVNASTLRTLSQTADFLGMLIEPKAIAAQHKLHPGLTFVVDDDALTCKAITASLATAGLRAETIERPSAALAALKVLPCDLIILDVGLPEMDGFELCKKIRQIPLHQKTPIIFLTGLATFQNRVQSSLVSGCDFMAKPFNVLELPVKVLGWMYRTRLALV